MEKKLIITVSGETNSGKSRLSFLLGELLSKDGFNVNYEVSPDYIDEQSFRKYMSSNLEEVINNIKNETEIIIKEEQLKVKKVNKVLIDRLIELSEVFNHQSIDDMQTAMEEINSLLKENF